MPAPRLNYFIQAAAATSLLDLKVLGGFDKISLAAGNWNTFYNQHPYTVDENGVHQPGFGWAVEGPNNSTWTTDLYTQGLHGAALSDYHYRNVASVIMRPQADPDGTDVAEEVYIAFTKPQIAVRAGDPPFRTQKLLGNRALVTDSFGKTYNGGSVTPSYYAVPPGIDHGMGVYAHREGYNVLYGDWSAKWYGDPQERIAWWQQIDASDRDPDTGIGSTNEDSGYMMSFYGLQGNGFVEWNPIPGSTATTTSDWFPDTGVTVWNLFDTDHGVDVR